MFFRHSQAIVFMLDFQEKQIVAWPRIWQDFSWLVSANVLKEVIPCCYQATSLILPLAYLVPHHKNPWKGPVFRIPQKYSSLYFHKHKGKKENNYEYISIHPISCFHTLYPSILHTSHPKWPLHLRPALQMFTREAMPFTWRLSPTTSSLALMGGKVAFHHRKSNLGMPGRFFFNLA